ncbi:MAG TPA: FAD-binding oxidoreductase [Candidatus Norongarragalinales archaeon]|nr:FAD-binding oxidoreductase [Candidatus Norongarragalinales archaeon]
MAPPIPPTVFAGRVTRVKHETHDTITVSVRAEDGREFKFKPGQWYSLFSTRPDGAWDEGRPYSISSSPTTPDHLDFTIKLKPGGGFTPKAFKMKEGDKVGLNGPFGLFVFDPEKHAQCVFVAAGVGVTPMMSMIRFATDHKLENKITLLYTNKTKGDIIYHHELVDLEKRNPHFKMVSTLTRCPPEEEWGGCRGRIDAPFLHEHLGSFEGKFFFICGGTEFALDMSKFLKGLGVPTTHVKHEGFG